YLKHFYLYSHGHHLHLYSFPTRRSSDLTTVGLKISGSDLKIIGKLGRQVEAVLATIPGTRTAFAERVDEGYFLNVDWNRDELGRSEEHTSELQSRFDLVCRLLLEKKKKL